MDDMTAQHRAAARAPHVDREMTRRMAGGRLEPDAVVETSVNGMLHVHRARPGLLLDASLEHPPPEEPNHQPTLLTTYRQPHTMTPL